MERCDRAAEDKHGARDEQDVLEDTRKRKDKAASCADEEDGSDVEQECNAGVADKDPRPTEFGETLASSRNEGDIPDAHDLHERRETLREGNNEQVDQRTDWRVVVQRDKRVHLEAVQENLDHHQTGRLELCFAVRNVHDTLDLYTVLTTTARAWTTKPTRSNLSSPLEARATPQEIMRTMTASLLLGSCSRNVHEMRRMATGTNAYN